MRPISEPPALASLTVPTSCPWKQLPIPSPGPMGSPHPQVSRDSLCLLGLDSCSGGYLPGLPAKEAQPCTLSLISCHFTHNTCTYPKFSTAVTTFIYWYLSSPSTLRPTRARTHPTAGGMPGATVLHSSPGAAKLGCWGLLWDRVQGLGVIRKPGETEDKRRFMLPAF